MKDKPLATRWQAFFNAVVATGPIGVIVMALIIVFACIVTGTPAPVIYAITVLMVVLIVLIIVVNVTMRHRGDTDPPSPEEPPQPSSPSASKRKK
jgi:hypothetical protein